LELSLGKIFHLAYMDTCLHDHPLHVEVEHSHIPQWLFLLLACIFLTEDPAEEHPSLATDWS
jgi:hypothetical protein